MTMRIEQPDWLWSEECWDGDHRECCIPDTCPCTCHEDDEDGER